MAQRGRARTRDGRWYGAAFLSTALLAAASAWRMIRHHDGDLLVCLPAISMGVFSAVLARRAKRGVQA